jgi:pimeloyl-ACP methyl ester carboxylesterase
LNGFWFGAKRPKRAVVWVHGLSSSAFSKLAIVEHLVDKETAALTFNNRGHDTVARLSHTGGTKSYMSGAAFERFEDCADDIQGAINFAKKQGAKNIYIVGHSTGCQKAAYWAITKGLKKEKMVKGIVLLAPISDYAGALMKYGLPKMRHMQAIAKSMLKSGRVNEFVTSKFWDNEPNSPQRFLSLYTPDSIEQSLFSYFAPEKPGKLLRKIRIPILAIFGEKDEYADRPAQEIVEWFEKNTKAPLLSLVAKRANHGFKGHEKAIAKAIKLWIVKK